MADASTINALNNQTPPPMSGGNNGSNDPWRLPGKLPGFDNVEITGLLRKGVPYDLTHRIPLKPGDRLIFKGSGLKLYGRANILDYSSRAVLNKTAILNDGFGNDTRIILTIPDFEGFAGPVVLEFVSDVDSRLTRPAFNSFDYFSETEEEKKKNSSQKGVAGQEGGDGETSGPNAFDAVIGDAFSPVEALAKGFGSDGKTSAAVKQKPTAAVAPSTAKKTAGVDVEQDYDEGEAEVSGDVSTEQGSSISTNISSTTQVGGQTISQGGTVTSGSISGGGTTEVSSRGTVQTTGGGTITGREEISTSGTVSSQSTTQTSGGSTVSVSGQQGGGGGGSITGTAEVSGGANVSQSGTASTQGTAPSAGSGSVDSLANIESQTTGRAAVPTNVSAEQKESLNVQGSVQGPSGSSGSPTGKLATNIKADGQAPGGPTSAKPTQLPSTSGSTNTGGTINIGGGSTAQRSGVPGATGAGTPTGQIPQVGGSAAAGGFPFPASSTTAPPLAGPEQLSDASPSPAVPGAAPVPVDAAGEKQTKPIEPASPAQKLQEPGAKDEPVPAPSKGAQEVLDRLNKNKAPAPLGAVVPPGADKGSSPAKLGANAPGLGIKTPIDSAGAAGLGGVGQGEGKDKASTSPESPLGAPSSTSANNNGEQAPGSKGEGGNENGEQGAGDSGPSTDSEPSDEKPKQEPGSPDKSPKEEKDKDETSPEEDDKAQPEQQPQVPPVAAPADDKTGGLEEAAGALVGEAAGAWWDWAAGLYFPSFGLTLLVMDYYWYQHRKTPKLFPMPKWKKIVTVLANLLPIVLLAFFVATVFIVGCNYPFKGTLSTINLAGGGEYCKIINNLEKPTGSAPSQTNAPSNAPVQPRGAGG